MAEAHEIHEVHHEHGTNSLGIVIGLVLLILALFVFLYYFVPALRNSQQISIPEKIDVNINQEGR